MTIIFILCKYPLIAASFNREYLRKLYSEVTRKIYTSVEIPEISNVTAFDEFMTNSIPPTVLACFTSEKKIVMTNIIKLLWKK